MTRQETILWHEYYHRYLPDHPFANGQGYVREHRLIVEKHLNCILLPWGIVHHIDGNKLNNDIKNLQPMMDHQHRILHHPVLDILCLLCNHGTSIIKGTNKHRWYKYLYGHICHKCYRRIQWRLHKK